MEITLSAEFIAIIGMGVVVLLAAVGGFIAQIRYTSKLPTRTELHAVRDELRQEMQVMREEFRRDMMTMREELREEFRRDVNSLRQEIAVMRAELITAIHLARPASSRLWSTTAIRRPMAPRFSSNPFDVLAGHCSNLRNIARHSIENLATTEIPKL